MIIFSEKAWQCHEVSTEVHTFRGKREGSQIVSQEISDNSYS